MNLMMMGDIRQVFRRVERERERERERGEREQESRVKMVTPPNPATDS